MIEQHKYQNALRSLNSILTRARWMAHESNATELAELLDATEILPKYIAQPEDATDEFRATIEDISQRFENCAHIIGEFTQDCVCTW
jgi:hypothetical protein